MNKHILISSLGAALGLMIATASQAAPVKLVDAIGVNKVVANGGSISDTRNATNAPSLVIKDGLVVSIAANTGFLGDVTYTLTHGGKTVTLLSANRDSSNLWDAKPLSFSNGTGYNVASSTLGKTEDCGSNDIVGSSEDCLNLKFLPVDSLSIFNGMSAKGDWILGIKDAGYDNTSGRSGRHGYNGPQDLTLAGWSVYANLTEAAIKPAQVPEPASLALVGLALGGAMLARRRNKKA